MKRKICTVVKITTFIVILLVLILLTSKIVQRKDSLKKYREFFEIAEQVDVLFLGSSHVLNGINPLQLYEEYGITSYNMAKNGGHVAESYWMFMNALEYCTPKCVVIDLWALERDYQYIDIMEETTSEVERKKYISFLHDSLDSWPMNKTKLESINDLLSSYEVRKEFYWDFLVYHDRWSTLEKEDFALALGKEGGVESLGARPVYWVHDDFSIYQMENNTEILSDDVISVRYLYRLWEECENRDIEVILTYLPMANFFPEDWKAVNTAEKIALENSLLFINLLPHEEQDVINYRTDMFDESHVNMNGMRKLTSYMGKYLEEVDGIIDHRDNAAYQNWNEKVNQWKEIEEQRLMEKDLYLELSMIQNLDVSTIVFMRGNSKALTDNMVQELVKQLTGTTGIMEAAECGGPYMLMKDSNNGSRKIQEFVGEQQIESFESILGDTEYIGIKEFGAIYVDGNLEHNYLNMEEHYNSDIQILILDREGEIIINLCYDLYWDDMQRVKIN